MRPPRRPGRPGRGTLMTGLALALLCLGGCAGRGPYPVKGKVVVKGNPFPVQNLQGYLVQLESETEPVVSATGTVQADGTFRVGTFKTDDGAVAGKHRVALTPPLEEEGKPRPRRLLDPRYHRFATSGLGAEVKPQANEIVLEVEALPR